MRNSNLHVGMIFFQGSRSSAFHFKFYCAVEYPPRGFVKLNFDGSRIHNSTAGIFIIHGWVGNLIKTGAAPYGDTSILVAEARALWEGLQEAIKAEVKFLIIEGDNSIVIQAIKGTVCVQWKIRFIIRDISHYLNQLSHVTVSHNYREANLAANCLAKLGHSLPAFTTWESPPSTELRDIMDDDSTGRALVRRGV